MLYRHFQRNTFDFLFKGTELFLNLFPAGSKKTKLPKHVFVIGNSFQQVRLKSP